MGKVFFIVARTKEKIPSQLTYKSKSVHRYSHWAQDFRKLKELRCVRCTIKDRYRSFRHLATSLKYSMTWKMFSTLMSSVSCFIYYMLPLKVLYNFNSFLLLDRGYCLFHYFLYQRRSLIVSITVPRHTLLDQLNPQFNYNSRCEINFHPDKTVL